MRIIANENVSASVIERLRAEGHDVLSVKKSMRGLGDPAVLARAQAEERLVVTHDKDFGELAFRFGLVASSGVILLRLTSDTPERDNQRAVGAILSRSDWEGHFSVVTEDRIRMRPLPSVRLQREEPNDG